MTSDEERIIDALLQRIYVDQALISVAETAEMIAAIYAYKSTDQSGASDDRRSGE